MSAEKPYKYIEIVDRVNFEVTRRIDVSHHSDKKIVHLEKAVSDKTNLKEFYVRSQSYEHDMKLEKTI
jgi:hypothetical protein